MGEPMLEFVMGDEYGWVVDDETARIIHKELAILPEFGRIGGDINNRPGYNEQIADIIGEAADLNYHILFHPHN